MSKQFKRFIKFSLTTLLLSACSPQAINNQGKNTQTTSHQPGDSQQLLVVDCLLPGQVRKLGTSMTFLSPRRPIRTTGLDCGIRGGEYVAYDRADYRTALNVWLSSAMEGDAKSQVYVGEIFEKGLGTLPDYLLAATWYRKAALQGDSRGAINLGYLYEKGLGVKKDTVAALNWYRQASGLNTDDLQFASTIEAASEEQFSLLRNEIALGQKQRTDLAALLHKKEQQLEKEQTVLQHSEQQIARLQQELESSDRPIQTNTAQVTSLQVQLEHQQLEVIKQRKQSAILKAKLENQQTLLTQAVATSQQKQRQYDQAKTQQQAALHKLSVDLKTSKRQLASAEQHLVQSSARLLEAQDKTSKSHQQLVNSTIEKEKSVQELEAEVNKRTAVIEALESNLSNELAKTKALQQQLKKKSSQQRLATLTLNEQYLTSQQDLTAAETQFNALSELLATEKNTSQRALAASKANLAEVRRLQVKMIQRKAELEKQRRHIASLESEMASHKTSLENMPTAGSPLAMRGPSIEILDPPITLTRGIPSVQLRSIMNERIITGKVLAPSGLLSLSINDSALVLDKYGVFTYPAAISTATTSVNIVAIDKRGRRAKVNFNLLPKSALGTPSQTAEKLSMQGKKSLQNPINFGTYHALIIGNNNYQNFNNLNSAVNDAREVEKILREHYDFKTSVVIDGDRYTILSALNKLRESLTEDDNLLIYYAGHGELDKVNQRGHWLPVDAELNSTANWISNIDITDILNAISARHIMVVADSCYSGTMTRSSLARLESGMSTTTKLKWFKVMAKTRSRSVLTSGGLKPVLDSGNSGHSVFANAFFEVLKQNTGILEGYKIYRDVSEKVRRQAAKYNVEQTPQYAPILHAGHEAGEFFFVSRQASLSKSPIKRFNSIDHQASRQSPADNTVVSLSIAPHY